MKETDKAALMNVGAAVKDAKLCFGKLEEERKQLSRHLPLAGGSRATSKEPPRSTVSSRHGSTVRERARRAAAPGVVRRDDDRTSGRGQDFR
jgi:hypothetical protein